MANTDKKPNTGPLWMSLYEELRNDILSRNIKNGSKLTESYVCKRYKVSRTPVREALMELESEGLVQIIPNRGAFVTGLSDRDILDIFDMRCLFEGQATEWAVYRMSSEDIDKLYETLDFMEFYTLKGDPDRIREFDIRFHDIICEGADNRMIQSELAKYRAYIRNTFPGADRSADQLKQVLEEHRAIFHAFETGNATEGRKAMEEHVRNSRARLISSLK